MKAVVAAFNQEKALVGAFSVIVRLWRIIVNSSIRRRGSARPRPGHCEPAPCTTVSLDFETLMRDLDTLYSKYSRMDRVNKVPIYNVQKDVMNMSHSPFPWWKPLSTYSEVVNFPQPVLPSENGQGNQKLLSLLHDFVADQKSQKTIMEDWKKMEDSKKKVANTKKETKSKMTRRGRDSVQKMKERRETSQSTNY